MKFDRLKKQCTITKLDIILNNIKERKKKIRI